MILVVLGGSSFSIRTSSLKDEIKWSTSKMSWNSLPYEKRKKLIFMEIQPDTIYIIYFWLRDLSVVSDVQGKHKLPNLGSAQKEVLCRSGTISIRYKYLAIATMSHICIVKIDLRCRNPDFWYKEKVHHIRAFLGLLIVVRIWLSPPLHETIRYPLFLYTPVQW